jgi:sugar porter (SP) family MFS transporter
MPTDQLIADKSRLEQPNLQSSTSFASRISLVAALGGVLFGYDTAIINGAIVFLRRQFGWTDWQTEFAAGSLLAGCVLGASFAGTLSDRYGRRRLLLLAAAIFAFSSIATALPSSLAWFSVARLGAGIAIGMASMLSPLYIAEVAPPDKRGRLVSLNQLAIVSGIVLSYFAGWLLSSLGENSWRWMFASAAAPSLLFWAAMLKVPESPRWLVKEGRDREAADVLARTDPSVPADQRLREIKEALAEESGTLAELLRPGLRRALLLSLALAVFQQITGINTILYYGSILFAERIGTADTSSALLPNVLIGIICLLATVVALFLVDSMGRRKLLLLASGGMGLSLVALGFAFALRPSAVAPILALMMMYVGCFSVGMGPVVWVLLAELFPTRVRGRAMSVATVTLWLATLAVTLTFLSLVSVAGPAGAFWIYGLMCFVNLVIVFRWIPETKGRTLEQIEAFWHIGKRQGARE